MRLLHSLILCLQGSSTATVSGLWGVWRLVIAMWIGHAQHAAQLCALGGIKCCTLTSTTRDDDQVLSEPERDKCLHSHLDHHDESILCQHTRLVCGIAHSGAVGVPLVSIVTAAPAFISQHNGCSQPVQRQ